MLNSSFDLFLSTDPPFRLPLLESDSCFPFLAFHSWTFPSVLVQYQHPNGTEAFMKKNEIFTLQADNLGADMEGVCRLDGMAVFVPGLLPGEETNVRIVKTEKRAAFEKWNLLPSH